MRLARSVLVMGCLFASAASAQPRPRVRRAHAASRVHHGVRDRFARTVLFGATVGVGSPRGFAGGFVELRPWRALGLAVGGGAGGGFGPSLDVTATVAPLGGRAWALGVEGSFSHQFSYGRSLAMPDGRAMPAGSNWLSAGVSFEVRPSRHLMLRVGAGRAWLVNTRDFGQLDRNELRYAEAQYDVVPGVNPLDANRAALDGETLGVWYVHVDIAPSWRW